MEQKICASQNDGNLGGDDDDGGMRSLRQMFEPPVNKCNGEVVNNLKARFEPKPRLCAFIFYYNEASWFTKKGKTGETRVELGQGRKRQGFSWGSNNI